MLDIATWFRIPNNIVKWHWTDPISLDETCFILQDVSIYVNSGRRAYDEENLMEFHIADTFTESLARLTGEEQNAVKITTFDLQVHPAQPGIQLHKLDKARDPNFLSVRVSRDIRLIVHRTAASLLLCYVDHHDNAYRRAVAVMACDDEVMPLQARIETVADDADLAEVYNTERHLLYVACIRARDHLLVTGIAPASEFLDDLQM
jgi:ABC-type cobalamin transport system ATPase subunit